MWNLLCNAIVVALAAAFAILFLDRTGWRTKVIATARWKIVSDLFGCDFCLGWWTGVVVAAALLAATGDASLLLVPVISTPITRALL